jgi:hypothetical protein
MNKLIYVQPEIHVIACNIADNMLQASHHDSTSNTTEENGGAELGSKGSVPFFDDDEPTEKP